MILLFEEVVPEHEEVMVAVFALVYDAFPAFGKGLLPVALGLVLAFALVLGDTSQDLQELAEDRVGRRVHRSRPLQLGAHLQEQHQGELLCEQLLCSISQAAFIVLKDINDGTTEQVLVYFIT